jgi:hypothetical protein
MLLLLLLLLLRVSSRRLLRLCAPCLLSVSMRLRD